MIDEVHIRDVALIHEATFAPSPAFTVVTGETGTGKTALLNALKILVGERAGASLVREGCDFLVSIPMKGRISSLNASAAVAILLYEAVRQRLG